MAQGLAGLMPGDKRPRGAITRDLAPRHTSATFLCESQGTKFSTDIPEIRDIRLHRQAKVIIWRSEVYRYGWLSARRAIPPGDGVARGPLAVQG